jgi:hypothetical protein
VIAIVAGLGGGLVIADMIHPKSAKQGTEMTRLERHMSSEPVQAKPGPSEPVQYLATPQLSAPVAAVAAAPAQAPPQTETGNSQSARAQPAETAAQPAAPASQPATPAVQPVAPQQAAAPNEDAVAKVRDADVRRAVEKRKLERRQQWAERRRQRQQPELRAVEERVREDTEPRKVFAAEPVRTEMPLIRLFGPE